jgi:hypothetical protein
VALTTVVLGADYESHFMIEASTTVVLGADYGDDCWWDWRWQSC